MREPKLVRIASEFVPYVYMRMDGRGVEGGGAGVVNCQYYYPNNPGPWEVFILEPQPDGSTAIASVAFPGVYLRLDGTGVTHRTEQGGGRVCCAWGVGETEKFWIMDVTDGPGTVIESAAFKSVFLSMDGSRMKMYDKFGSGTVNAQYQAGHFERFMIVHEEEPADS
jgi:phospholipase C